MRSLTARISCNPCAVLMTLYYLCIYEIRQFRKNRLKNSLDFHYKTVSQITLHGKLYHRFYNSQLATLSASIFEDPAAGLLLPRNQTYDICECFLWSYQFCLPMTHHLYNPSFYSHEEDHIFHFFHEEKCTLRCILHLVSFSLFTNYHIS